MRTAFTGFDLGSTLLAAGVCLSLIAQIAEQNDYLRFMPPKTPENKRSWWTWMFLAGPGWVIFGAIKQIVGLFLAVYLIANVADGAGIANQPVHQFLEIYKNFLPNWLAMTLAVCLVVISQIKINVTNAYSGSLAWTNSFTRVTKTYPGRLVFLGFNLLIALILMEANMFDFLNTILGLLRQLRYGVGRGGGVRHRVQQVPVEALAEGAGVPSRHAVQLQPGRLRLDADRRGRVDPGVLRRSRLGDHARTRRWSRSVWRWCCRRSSRSRRRASTTCAAPTTASTCRCTTSYGNPSDEHLKCHVCHHDYERPDMMKSARPTTRYICSLCLSTDKSGRPRAACADVAGTRRGPPQRLPMVTWHTPVNNSGSWHVF